MATAPLSKVVLFLDVDGVLLPVPRFQFGGGDLSDESIRVLSAIIHRCGGVDAVTIILSSTWRNFPEYIARLNAAFEKVNKALRAEAAEASSVPYSTIPMVTSGTPNGVPRPSTVTYLLDDPTEQRLVKDRVDEIHRWIRTHMEDFPEACGGRWLAIDDMDLGLDTRMADHFLKTETEVGLDAVAQAAAFALVDALPDPVEARRRSQLALVDPAVKNEEIDILQGTCRTLEAKLRDATQELQSARTTIQDLQAAQRDQARSHKELERRFEDVSQRLAVYDYAKRHAELREAVELAGKLTGAARKEVDAHIKRYVEALRLRKELQKKEAATRKRAAAAAAATSS